MHRTLYMNTDNEIREYKNLQNNRCTIGIGEKT